MLKHHVKSHITIHILNMKSIRRLSSAQIGQGPRPATTATALTTG